MLSYLLRPQHNAEESDLISSYTLTHHLAACHASWLVHRFPPPVTSQQVPSQNASSFCSTFLADHLAVSFSENIKAITRELPQTPTPTSTHLSTCSVSLLVPAGKLPVLLSKGGTSLLLTSLLAPAQKPHSRNPPLTLPRHQFFSLLDCFQLRETTHASPTLQQSPLLLPTGASFSL